MENQVSKGKCVFCEKMFGKKSITRHLSSHLKKIEKEQKTLQRSYHIKIPSEEMFLELLVDGSMTLGDLDDFLRAIWLECCGHLSSFQISGKRYDFDFDSNEFGENMSELVGNIFRKGMKLKYDYDFGSTTRLEIRVMNEYKIAEPLGIRLMSRNEPLPILCDICRKNPAVTVCSIHVYDEESNFCKSCSKKHAKTCADFADYAQMSIVNSPRFGVCAYEGGMIDLERDGVYKQ